MTAFGERPVALVSEDDALTRFSMVDTLGQLGFATVETETAELAWDLIRRQPDIDLLITDIRLAGNLDGLDLAYRVATERPDTRILIVSGFSEDMFNSEQPTRYAYLPKPFSDTILSRQVASLMGRGT